MDVAECWRAAVWAAGLCALAAGSVLLALLPRDREGANAGLASGVALGVFGAAVWFVAAKCGIE